MWIRGCAAIINQGAQPCTLKNSTLVIDAQNFMYNFYERSYLNYQYGPECDLYADYLRKQLNMFKEANMKCYFIFKGGTKNLEKKIVSEEAKFYFETKKSPNINPIFMNDIHLQILDEMGFDYVFTEYEAKVDCIALAKELSCPVLSLDVEFSFSEAQYIPWNTLMFNEKVKGLDCKMVSLNNFLQRFSIDKEKLAIFILISDENIFMDNVFCEFFKKLKMPIENSYKRHMILLQWLSRTSIDLILNGIFNCKTVPKERILEEIKNIKNVIYGEFNGLLAINIILDRNYLTEHWFEKGVALNFIAKQYIDIYRSKLLLIKEEEKVYVLTPLSIKIIKYAYDLLTNFCSDGFDFIVIVRGEHSARIRVSDSIKKPNCLADSNVFENGWDNISALGLFEHFIVEEINFNFDALQMVPDDLKLLIIALVYYSRKKTEDMTKLSCSILLSYVMLNIVKDNNTAEAREKASVSSTDCKLASESLNKYFQAPHIEMDVETTENLLHPMFEFQHCLKHLNYLNRLCGLPFKPTIYGKTYNGTFIYNILCSIQDEECLFFEKILRSSPTVLKFVNHTINLYKSMM